MSMCNLTKSLKLCNRSKDWVLSRDAIDILYNQSMSRVIRHVKYNPILQGLYKQNDTCLLICNANMANIYTHYAIDINRASYRDIQMFYDSITSQSRTFVIKVDESSYDITEYKYTDLPHFPTTLSVRDEVKTKTFMLNTNCNIAEDNTFEFVRKVLNLISCTSSLFKLLNFIVDDNYFTEIHFDWDAYECISSTSIVIDAIDGINGSPIKINGCHIPCIISKDKLFSVYYSDSDIQIKRHNIPLIPCNEPQFKQIVNIITCLMNGNLDTNLSNDLNSQPLCTSLIPYIDTMFDTQCLNGMFKSKSQWKVDITQLEWSCDIYTLYYDEHYLTIDDVYERLHKSKLDISEYIEYVWPYLAIKCNGKEIIDVLGICCYVDHDILIEICQEDEYIIMMPLDYGDLAFKHLFDRVCTCVYGNDLATLILNVWHQLPSYMQHLCMGVVYKAITILYPPLQKLNSVSDIRNHLKCENQLLEFILLNHKLPSHIIDIICQVSKVNKIYLPQFYPQTPEIKEIICQLHNIPIPYIRDKLELMVPQAQFASERELQLMRIYYIMACDDMVSYNEVHIVNIVKSWFEKGVYMRQGQVSLTKRIKSLTI